MNRKAFNLLAALLAGAALVVAAGCNQQEPAGTVGQKLDRATDKVAAVSNDVANRTAEVVDDAAITAKVKAAILAEPGLRSLQIGVDTKDAVVTLTGSVDTAQMKDRAKQIAETTSGVRSVVDHLVAKSAG